MKRKQNDEKNELFFKNLASSYAEQSGNELKKEELLSIDAIDTLDKKVKGVIKTEKIKRQTVRILPLASCFIIFIVIIIGLPVFNAIPETPSKILTYEFINAKLPSGYTLQKVDYDRQKAIYYIATDTESGIILTVEEFEGAVNTEGLEEINISDINAYGISKEDYSFIQYKKDNFLYTLTSPHDYYDLIRLSKNLI